MNDQEIEWTEDGVEYALSLLHEERGEGSESNACLYVGGWEGDSYWGMSEGDNLATGISALIEELDHSAPEILEKVRVRLEAERQRAEEANRQWIERSMRAAGLL